MNVAFIPVRGGSKSIPLKNIKLFNGKPLVYWTVKAACGCQYIDKVYVATDSSRIKEAVEEFENERDFFRKIKVIGRSAESASDTASTEFAMLEFATQNKFDNIVLIQATSPLLTSRDLNRGFEAFKEENVDSVISVVPQKRFNWAVNDDGFAHPTNYDVFNRPRRQEFKEYYVENGAFYITSRERLMRFRNRVSGNIKAVEMDESTFFEIDEPSDWELIEGLMKKKHRDLLIEFPKIKMMLTDCDGCLTDGGMYYSEKGDELKKFNTKDGMGFKMLREKGIVTGIITGERMELNRKRAEKLKLDILEAGCRDKLEKINSICRERKIELSEVLYIGDDINDLEVMEQVGYSCCPSDAVQIIKNTANYVTKARGGQGVIREVVEMIIENQFAKNQQEVTERNI